MRPCRSCRVVGALGALALAAGCSGAEEPWEDANIFDTTPAPPREGVAPPELPCTTELVCEAKDAQAECGSLGATGRRAPELGAPYCMDKRSRQKCHCDIVRCQSAAPLCPGTYKATFRERLVAGCDGTPGQLGGSCQAGWNVVELMPQGKLLAERSMLNTTLAWDFADYSQVLTLTGVTPVRLAVEQYTWFADVSGAGSAGRMEVSRVHIALQ